VAIYLEALSSLSGTTASTPAVRKAFPAARYLHWAFTAAITLAAVLFAVGYFQRVAKPAAAIRLSINSPTGGSFGTRPVRMALSPDGHTLVFEQGGRLWKRELKESTASPLAGTEGEYPFPFWSPDSRFVGFFAERKLKVIDMQSGSIRVVCDAPAGRGGTWSS